MKLNYHNKLNNKNQTKRIIFFAFVLIFVAVVFRPLLGHLVSYVNNSVFSISNWLLYSSDTIPAYFRDRNDLIREIDNLRSKIASFDGDRKTISNLIEENKTLHSLLASTSSPRILGNIIGRPPQLPFDALLIDVGSDDGVKEKELVYIHNDKAIGVVARVFPRSAIVALATSPGFTSSVYVIGPNIFTTAVGEGGGVLKVQVPQGLVLKEGDLVVVPALGGGIYGTITKVVSIPTEPVQIGYLTMGTPIQSLRAVTISQEPVDTISFDEALKAVREIIQSQSVITVPEEFATSTLLQDTASTTSNPFSSS